jgi:hypothetical protein
VSPPVTSKSAAVQQLRMATFRIADDFQLCAEPRPAIPVASLPYAGFAKRPWSLASARHSGFLSLLASRKARRTPSALKSLA